ncbi:E3 ubiquitin-protein ligase SH3RF1, partial [Stegodyphus mimosarum]
MNAAARAVMKLSSNVQSSSSRILPPLAPSTDSHFVTAQTLSTTSSGNATQSPQYQESGSGASIPQPVSSGINPPFSSSAFTSPIHNNSSLNMQQNAGIAAYPGTSYDSHHASSSHHRQTQQVTSGAKGGSDDHQGPTDNTHDSSVIAKSRSTPSPGPVFSSVASVTPPLVSQRAESIAGAQTPPQANPEDSTAITSPLVCSSDAGKSSHTPARSSSGTSQPPTHVPVPTFYLALYTYRPLKEDELELRKGELYTVSEKCQ